MLDQSLLTEAVDRAAGAAERAFGSDSVVDYEELDLRVRELENLARQLFQDAHRRLYESLADKLEHGGLLSPVERGALELLIVGEAQYYLKAENNYQDWKKELARLVEEVRRTDAEQHAGAEKLLHLQALCHDAKGVLPDITFYLRQRDRIDRFREATAGEIQPQDARFLARVIRQMISSERR